MEELTKFAKYQTVMMVILLIMLAISTHISYQAKIAMTEFKEQFIVYGNEDLKRTNNDFIVNQLQLDQLNKINYPNFESKFDTIPGFGLPKK